MLRSSARLLVICFIFQFIHDQVLAQSTARDPHHAIKINPLAPATGHLTLGYEWKWNHRYNLDINLGVIGIGKHFNSYLGYYNVSNWGFLASAGIKFKLGKRYRTLESSPFRGFYVRPKLIFTHYKYPDESHFFGGIGVSNFMNSTTSVIGVAEFGYQTLIVNRILFEVWLGVGQGYNFQRESSDRVLDSFLYSHFDLKYVKVTGGIMLGYTF